MLSLLHLCVTDIPANLYGSMSLTALIGLVILTLVLLNFNYVYGWAILRANFEFTGHFRSRVWSTNATDGQTDTQTTAVVL